MSAASSLVDKAALAAVDEKITAEDLEAYIKEPKSVNRVNSYNKPGQGGLKVHLSLLSPSAASVHLRKPQISLA